MPVYGCGAGDRLASGHRGGNRVVYGHVDEGRSEAVELLVGLFKAMGLGWPVFGCDAEQRDISGSMGRDRLFTAGVRPVYGHGAEDRPKAEGLGVGLSMVVGPGTGMSTAVGLGGGMPMTLGQG